MASSPLSLGEQVRHKLTLTCPEATNVGHFKCLSAIVSGTMTPQTRGRSIRMKAHLLYIIASKVYKGARVTLMAFGCVSRLESIVCLCLQS